MEKIAWEKVKVKDLRIGDDVFDEDLKVGLVIKRGKTILHSHPYTIIRFSWCNWIGEKRTDTRKYEAEELEEDIYHIYWVKKAQKSTTTKK